MFNLMRNCASALFTLLAIFGSVSINMEAYLNVGLVLSSMVCAVYFAYGHSPTIDQGHIRLCQLYGLRARHVTESGIIAMLGRRLLFFLVDCARLAPPTNWFNHHWVGAFEKALGTWPIYTGFYYGYPWALFVAVLVWKTQDSWWEPTMASLNHYIVEPFRQFSAHVCHQANRSKMAVVDCAGAISIFVCRCWQRTWNVACHRANAAWDHQRYCADNCKGCLYYCWQGTRAMTYHCAGTACKFTLTMPTRVRTGWRAVAARIGAAGGLRNIVAAPILRMAAALPENTVSGLPIRMSWMLLAWLAYLRPSTTCFVLCTALVCVFNVAWGFLLWHNVQANLALSWANRDI